MNFVANRKRSSLSKIISLSAAILLTSYLLVPQGLIAATPPIPSIPTLIWPQSSVHSITGAPIIKGLTQNDTEVEVYIDSQLNGMAKVKNGKQETASFAYSPFLTLKPGNHAVAVRAIDNTGQKSKLSEAVPFLVEKPYPAPSLFQPVVNSKTVSTKPFIVGVAANNSVVKVFIDGKLDGQFKVTNSESGTASFAYQPFLELDPTKDHLVYATAVGFTGKESAYSNVIGFKVEAPEAPVTENPLVLGVSDIQEEGAATTEENQQAEATTKDETMTDQEITAANEESANTEDTEGDTTKDADSRRSTAIWWVILIIAVIVVAVNLRGRGKKDTQGGLKGLEGLGKKDDHSSNSFSSDSKSEQQTLLNKEESKDNQSGNKDMPPPPPSK